VDVINCDVSVVRSYNLLTPAVLIASDQFRSHCAQYFHFSLAFDCRLLPQTRASSFSLQKLAFNQGGYSASNNKKFAQSNLGRWPRRGTVAHVRRKVPTGYNGAPQIRPKSTPSRRSILKPHYLPHPWTRPTYDAKRHPDPIRRFSTMHWTDRQIVQGKV